jgi:hypothetical protein
MVSYLATPHIRQPLETILGRRLSIAELERIENAARPLLERLRSGAMTPVAFACQLKMLQLDAAPPPKPKSRRPGERTVALRSLALASLVARAAGADPGVVAFRARHLPEGIIGLESVGDWVRRRAAFEGPPSHLVTFALAPGEAKGARLPREGEIRRREVLELPYPRLEPGLGLIVAHQPIAAGGVLDQLLCLIERLVAQFGWSSPAYAAAFVLSGAIPPVARLRVELDERMPAALSRIRIDASAAATPKEIAEAFRSAQSSIRDAAASLAAIRARPAGRRRNRSVGERLLRLAQFVGEVGAADRPAMEEWNRTHPRMRYHSLQDFQTKARRAVANVVGGGLEPGAIFFAQSKTLAPTLAVRNEKRRKKATK